MERNFSSSAGKSTAAEVRQRSGAVVSEEEVHGGSLGRERVFGRDEVNGVALVSVGDVLYRAGLTELSDHIGRLPVAVSLDSTVERW